MPRSKSALPEWRNAEFRAMTKWRRDHPKRYYLMLKAGLDRLHVRYCEQIIFWNPYHTPALTVKGQKTFVQGGYQALDVIVKLSNHTLLVILFENRHNVKAHEKKLFAAKLQFLEKKHIPVLVVPTYYTSQEYQITIANRIHRLKRSYGS